MADDEPAAPARVGQLMPDPLPVPLRQPRAEREPHLTARPRVPRDPAPGDQSGSSQIEAPAETVWPTATASPVTVPSLCAVSGCSIFIASRTTITSPAATRSPSATAILTIVPCIGLTSVSPLPAGTERRDRLAPRTRSAEIRPGETRRDWLSTGGGTPPSPFPP